MNNELTSQINQYLSDETKLYQDWYTGLTQTEDSQYTKQVGIIPDLSKLKKLCEDWINQHLPILKENLCLKVQQLEGQEESKLVATVADVLTVIFPGVPMNRVAVSVILVSKKYLKRICDSEL
jgi:hypothetical protein